MKYIKYILMATVSFVIINVWFFRLNKVTIYRGGEARNMVEEFAAYGLNETVMYLIGGLKILAVLGLLIGFYLKKVILPSALTIAILMLGAIAMHFKVSDAAIKFLPAGLMFVFSIIIILIDTQKEQIA
jgi:hypothetical protein